MASQNRGQEPDLPFDPFAEGKPREACGLFAVSGARSSAAVFTVLGLHALQHRGQDATGIVVRTPDRHLRAYRGRGMVGQVFSPERTETLAVGEAALGHLRYATAGDDNDSNIQPLVSETKFGPVALAHNGNVVNAQTLRRSLLDEGARFFSSSDTELFLQLLSRSRAKTLEEAFLQVKDHLVGAWALVALTQDKLIGLRDERGMRPLVLGTMEDGGAVLTSETCALEMINATWQRDLEAGELLVINKGDESKPPVSFMTQTNTTQTNTTQTNAQAEKPSRNSSTSTGSAANGTRTNGSTPPAEAKPRHSFCAFEFVYFMRPDSAFMGRSVAQVRSALGRQLHSESPAVADLVIPVPDSGVQAATGYAEAAGLPYAQGILRSHYTGRTFIEPAERIRNLGIKLKLSVVPSLVAGKRVVLVDDSLVRGSTMPKIIALLRRQGAAEIHVRISSPKFMNPCYFGIDTASADELIAPKLDDAALRETIGADSLAFLSQTGLARALKDTPEATTRNTTHATTHDTAHDTTNSTENHGASDDKATSRFCYACFDGAYPTDLPDLKAGLLNQARSK